MRIFFSILNDSEIFFSTRNLKLGKFQTVKHMKKLTRLFFTNGPGQNPQGKTCFLREILLIFRQNLQTQNSNTYLIPSLNFVPKTL